MQGASTGKRAAPPPLRQKGGEGRVQAKLSRRPINGRCGANSNWRKHKRLTALQQSFLKSRSTKGKDKKKSFIWYIKRRGKKIWLFERPLLGSLDWKWPHIYGRSMILVKIEFSPCAVSTEDPNLAEVALMSPLLVLWWKSVFMLGFTQRCRGGMLVISSCLLFNTNDICCSPIISPRQFHILKPCCFLKAFLTNWWMFPITCSASSGICFDLNKIFPPVPTDPSKRRISI